MFTTGSGADEGEGEDDGAEGAGLAAGTDAGAGSGAGITTSFAEITELLASNGLSSRARNSDWELAEGVMDTCSTTH